MPSLPDVNLINEILDEYKTYLDRQSATQTTLTNYYDKFTIKTKKDIAEDLKAQYESYRGKSDEAATQFWMNNLESLRQGIITTQTEHTRWLHSFSKKVGWSDSESGFELVQRTIYNIVCTALREYGPFQHHVNMARQEYKKQKADITAVTDAAYAVHPTLIKKRNDALIRLVDLWDEKAIVKAANKGLLNEHNKPEPAEKFTLSTPFNPSVATKAAIRPDVPWCFQFDMALICIFRLRRNHYPKSLEEFKEFEAEWKNKKQDTLNKQSAPPKDSKNEIVEEKKPAATELQTLPHQNSSSALANSMPSSPLSSTASALKQTYAASSSSSNDLAAENKTPLATHKKLFKTEQAGLTAALDSLGLHGQARKEKMKELKKSLPDSLAAMGIVIEDTCSPAP